MSSRKSNTKRQATKRRTQPEIATDSETVSIDRRTFVKIVPALGAGIVASNLNLNVLTQLPAASPSPTPSPSPQKPSPLAEAYAEVAKVRFGDQMQPAQWEQMKRELEGNVRNADRLRAFKLQNGDEPDFVFTA
jgi:hypothetical protein